MKILKIALISVFILLVILIAAIFVFIQTFDINRFKPKIVEQASAALNHSVGFEKAQLGFNFKQGVNLKIYNFYISEKIPFGNGDFLSVKEISLGVDILGYILQRKIVVPSVVIDTLRVNVIRQNNGNLNVNTFVAPSENLAAGQNDDSKQPPANIPVFLISTLEIINSNVNYLDQLFTPEVKLDVKDLKVTLSKISLNESFPFTLEACALSDKKNIQVAGKLQYDLTTGKVTVSELKSKTDLANLILAKVLESLPMLKNDNFPTKLQGKLEFDVNKLIAGAKGLESLDSKLYISEGAVEMKSLAVPATDLNVDAQITEKNITFDKLAVSLKDGKVLCSGVIEDYIVKQAMDLKIDAKDLKIQELLNQEKFSVKVDGLVSTQMKLKAEGLTQEAFLKTLVAEGNVKMSQGKLKDINILKSVFDQMTIVSGLSEKLEKNLAQNYKDKLTQKDTNLLDIDLPVKIGEQKIFISDTLIGAQEFNFKGNAQAGFDGTYGLEGAFMVPVDLSTSMVAAVSELEYLLNQDKQIYVPLKVAGSASGVTFSVDMEYMGKQIVVNQGKKQLTDVIDKALGQSGDGNSSTKELVGSILDSVFK